MLMNRKLLWLPKTQEEFGKWQKDNELWNIPVEFPLMSK